MMRRRAPFIFDDNCLCSTALGGAGGGDRTHTSLVGSQDFKSCASASFATPAWGIT